MQPKSSLHYQSYLTCKHFNALHIANSLAFWKYFLMQFYGPLLSGRYVYFQLTQHLFQGNDTAGMDLVALNLQRGRDHGLAPYVKWRKLCGLPDLNSWKEVAMNANFPHLVPRLQQLYGR